MLKLGLTLIGGLAAGILSASAVSAQPAGSYMGSCTRIVQRGPNLFAMCKDMNGDWVRTGLNVRSCRGPIANTDGHLTCPGGRAAYPARFNHHGDERMRHDHDRDRRDFERDPRVNDR